LQGGQVSLPVAEKSVCILNPLALFADFGTPLESPFADDQATKGTPM